MKVAELIKILEKMPKDAKVSYFDTYWQSEGWGEHAKEPYYNEVCAIEYNEEDNSVELS